MEPQQFEGESRSDTAFGLAPVVRLIAVYGGRARGAAGELAGGGVEGAGRAGRRFVFEVGGRGRLRDTRTVLLGEAELVSAMGDNLCALQAREVRRLHVLLRKEAVGAVPALAAQLQPRCVLLGYCDLPQNADGRCQVRPYVTASSRPAENGSWQRSKDGRHTNDAPALFGGPADLGAAPEAASP
jgi:hypothetical protein